MEFLGRIFNRNSSAQEQAPSTLSDEVVELVDRWRDQVRNRRNPETVLVTADLLYALVNTPDLFFGGQLKFVRQSDKVALSIPGVDHSRIADAGGLSGAHDAGAIEKDKQKVDRLVVTGGSGSFHIDSGNKNRPNTVKVLRKIAPKIRIDQAQF